MSFFESLWNFLKGIPGFFHKLITNPIGLIWDPISAFLEKQLNIASVFLVTIIIVQFLNNYLEQAFNVNLVIQLVINYVFMFGAAMYFKYNEVKDTCEGKGTGGFIFWRAFVESIISVCVTDVLIKITPYVPIIGPGIRILGAVPFVGEALLWVGHYLIFVLMYGLAKGLFNAVLGKDKYCSKISWPEGLLAVLSLFGSVGAKMADEALGMVDDLNPTNSVGSFAQGAMEDIAF